MANNKVKVIGFESANSYVKVFSEGDCHVYPNTVSKSAKETFNVLSSKGIFTQYEFEGYKYNVGHTTDYITSSMNDIGRYSSDAYRRESITALSHCAKDGDVIRAVTGIPALHYDNSETITRDINNNLRGVHNLVIDGEEVTITVKEVLVTLQPLASFFYMALDDLGNLEEEMIERFADNKTLVIDIGWGTTDVADCFSNGLVSFKPINTSMRSAYETLREEIKLKFPDRNIVSANIPLMELEKKIRKGHVIEYGNEHYDCSDLVTKIFQETTSNILQEVRNLYNLSEYTTVMFTGGGTAGLFEYLEAGLQNPKTKKRLDNVVMTPGPQEANTKGYYVYGAFINV